MKKWLDEKLYELDSDKIGHKQSFLVEKELVNVSTKFQDLQIIKTPFFGKVLLLDGIIQTTEKDEFFYHEMFSHVPLFAHHNPKQVLIIGAGDGGILREVLKHKSVERAMMIEIDAQVIEYSKQELPSLNAGAFNDPRAVVLSEDGIKFVKETQDKFDVIIVDSTDPVGAAKVLFTDDFYTNCKKCLNKGGILTSQSGVPFFQAEELQDVNKMLSNIYGSVNFYLVPVPSYVGSFMCLSFATEDGSLSKQDKNIIESRFLKSGIKGLKYYNPEIHTASFSLPEYIKQILAK